MVALRRWSGKHVVAGLVAWFLGMQSLLAGVHAAHLVDLQLSVLDPSSICHGGASGSGVPTQPISNLAGTCCLAGCNIVGHVADVPELLVLGPPALSAGVVRSPSPPDALLPSHLTRRAHQPRSPPLA
jgi:hypothetical protein